MGTIREIIREERNGGCAAGSFVALANGRTRLPSKGDSFAKKGDSIYLIG